MSVNVMIEGYSDNTPRNILDLSFNISTPVMAGLEKAMTPVELALFQEQRRFDAIAADGTDVFETTGIINFYLFGIPIRLHQLAIWQMTEAVRALGVTHGTAYINKSNLFGVDTIRLPISAMPEVDLAPEMNITMSSADVIMSALKMEQYRGEYSYDAIPVDDIIIAANSLEITDDLLSPNIVSQGTHGVTMLTQGYDVQRIIRLRDCLLSIAQWAKSHHYDTLYIA